MSIASNEEYLKNSRHQSDELIGMIRKRAIRIHSVLENQRSIHVTGYFVDGEKGCTLFGLVSPSLTRSSDQKMELLAVFAGEQRQRCILYDEGEDEKGLSATRFRFIS